MKLVSRTNNYMKTNYLSLIFFKMHIVVYWMNMMVGQEPLSIIELFIRLVSEDNIVVLKVNISNTL